MKRLTSTQQALKLVDAGMSAYKAAQEIGINRSVITRALKRRAEKEVVCPTCKRPLQLV